ncbi:MAG TPA: FtsQ-type POTRA domain-containing protein [Bacteroidales bacterium]|nr:FtsQ-type POTRA domain-containing protein [Bacteroidales bacterium]
MKLFKKILIILFWVVLAGSMITLMDFINNKNGELKVDSIEVTIQRATDVILITEEDVMNLIGNENNRLVGQPFGEIRLEDLENRLKHNGYIADANIHSRIPGDLYIDIVQRTPLIRVINGEYEQFYLSTDGHTMALHPSVVRPSLLATGLFPDSLDPAISLRTLRTLPEDEAGQASALEIIYNLALHIRGDEFLNAQIEQIFINGKNEAEMIPKVGDHLILFGNLEHMEGKFHKLIAFYREGVRFSGWDAYDTVNLKYKNQIVCTK